MRFARLLPALAVILAVGVAEPAYAVRVVSGTYGGATLLPQSVSTGFRPGVVIVKGNNAQPAVIKTRTMAGNYSKFLEPGGGSDGIRSLNAGGFTVGLSGTVNALLNSYTYVAIEETPGEIVLGSYTGNGSAGRIISGVGFSPTYVMVLAQQGNNGVQRFAGQPANESLLLGLPAKGVPRITNMAPDGFEVSADAEVNAAGVTYHYVAFAAVAGEVATGNYTGDGSASRVIASPPFRSDYLLVRAADPAGTTVHRGSANGDNTAMHMVAKLNLSNAIKRFFATGFEVGNRPEVNAPASSYYWLSLRNALLDADAAVAISADRTIASLGNTISIKVTADNAGARDITGLKITSLLPAGLTYVSHIASRGAYNPLSGLWNVGALDMGDSEELTIAALVGVAGPTSLIVPVTVTALDQTDGNTSNNTATLPMQVIAQEFRMATGTYTGNGSGSRPFSGLGFPPDVVLIAGENGAGSVMRTATMAAGLAKELAKNTGLIAGAVQTLDPDGFTVGNNTTANAAGVVYHWTAFQSAGGSMKVGSYVGDGIDDRSILGVGFQPGYLLVMSSDNEEVSQRFAPMGGDASARIDAANLDNDRVQGFESDGFQVGKHNSVNEPGRTLHYVAWKDGAAQARTGIYIGSSGPASHPEIGFRPLAMIVRRGGDGWATVHRTASMAGTKTLTLATSAPFLNAITAFNATGFDLGSHSSVNQGNILYFWSAFRDSRETNVAVNVVADDATPNVGDNVTLDVTVKNEGPNDATNLEVTAPLPPGLAFVSASAGQGSYNSTDGRWTIGTLTNGASALLSFQATVQSGQGGSEIIQTAKVTSITELDVNSIDDSASETLFVQAAELGVEIHADSSFASVGDTLLISVGIANNGPNDASNVVADVVLPPMLTYLWHGGDGVFTAGTGNWTVPAIPGLGAATMTIVASTAPSSAGSRLTTHASIMGADQEDPAAANNADSVSVLVFTPTVLTDVPGSLYPASAAVGQPALALRIGLDNPSNIGVTLATTSTISFTDGAATYSAPLKNPTLVPPGASDFTLSFDAAAVPPSINPGVSYELQLVLEGTTSESVVYSDTLLTKTRNEIFVTEPEMVVTTGIVGDQSANPGEASVELLRLEFQSPFSTPRTVDSLTVTNISTGAGTAADLDALARAVHLYGDVDGNGALSPPDSLLGTTTFTNGRATFDATWVVPSFSVARVIVAADIDSALARDGDVLDAAVTFESDIVFAETTPFAGSISPLDPLNSYGDATIDGMVAMQLSFSDAGVDTLVSGATNAWIGTLRLPKNGYADDVLNRIEVADFSGGFNPADVAALDLVRDDGDGVYQFGTDLPLGRFAFSGDRYALSGLAEAVASGNRFFLVATASGTPNDGDTFLPGIPMGGITMASGNDGPLDAPVITAQPITFRRTDAIQVTAHALAPLTVNPGRAQTPMLWFDLQNNSAGSVTLDSLEIDNVATGSGSTAELDGDYDAVHVYADNGDGIAGAGDVPLATGLTFSGGSVVARSLGLDLPASGVATILVTCDVDSFCAADGDLLALAITAPSSVHTSSSLQVTGTFPLATSPARGVDGMVAHQLFLHTTPDTLMAEGSSNHLVFDVSLHGNGYANDVLQSLTVENLGTANEAHVALALFADGGDGVFDAGLGDDVSLGPLGPIGGNRFRITALTWPLPGACGQNARLYVAANIVASPPSGASLQISVPTGGIVVASGNDGPIDAPVVNPSINLIPRPDELTVFPYSVGDRRVHPGATNVLNFGVGLYNGFDTPLVLNAARLFQKGSATAGEIVRVRAWADQDDNGLFDPALDKLLTTTTSNDVYYQLSAIDLPLPPKKISYLFATCDPSITVRDSVSINLQLNSDTDLTLPGKAVVHGEFPVDSPGEDVSDGMVTTQIGVANAPGRTVPPGDADVFVLGFTVPRNGMLHDVLQRVTVANAGTAAPGQDIVFLNLWAEGNGNTTFEPAGDRLLTSLTWNGSGWRNPSPLAEAIPIAGLRCYVSALISGTAADGRTIRGFLPLGGLQVASGNDGPIDAIVQNAGAQVISTDPLIASMLTDRVSYSSGQSITVTMSVRNAGAVTLTGVYPDSMGMSGNGSAALANGPVPATMALDPGETDTFVWTFSATAPGSLSFCGSASDSTVTSLVVCADPVVIQSRPSAVAVLFDDHSPSAVNRGQRSIPVMRFDVDHTDPDTLAAAVRTGRIVIGVMNNAGAPVAPNSVLSGLTLVSSTGTNTFFSLADSAASPVHLTLPQPARIEPGESFSIDVVADVAPGAVLAPFRLGVAAASHLGIVDDNDGAPVALAPSTPFPWVGSAIDVDEPATVVLASDDALTTATANMGQHNVILWDGTMTNGSAPTAAAASVTSIMVDFHDGIGNAIAPSTAITRIAIFGGGAKLFETSSLPAASTVRFDFSSPFVLAPQQPRPFVVEVDVHTAPVTSVFGVTVAAPAAIAARDDNSGLAIAVQAGGGASFPLVSRSIALQQPATGLAASLESLAPETILPSMAGVSIARMRLSHADAASSSIVVDSLALVFRTPEGAAFYPGNYFNRIRVIGSADTLATLTTLSSVSSVVECRFATPIVLGPAGGDSLTIAVDAKSTYVPGAFVVRIDRELIHAVDANDPSRAIGISGAFPLQSSAANMRIPGANVHASANSFLPANVSGSERSLPVLGFTLDNRAAAGFTAARFESLLVVVQGRGGVAVNATGVVAAARLIESDSLVCDATVTAAGVSFRLPPDYTLVPGSKRDLTLSVDLAGNGNTQVFRFAVVDATAVRLKDVSTSVDLTPGSDSGFPLASRYTHVLGTDEASFTNYPNPFAAGRGSTRVTFFLENPSRVTLRLFTLWGDPVATLVGGTARPAGLHQDVTWDGRNGDGDVVNNGVYYLVLDVAPDTGTPVSLRRKVAVVR